MIAFVGDGSYLMLNSELYSATLAGDKLIVVLCDNGGYAVIHRLQVGQGGAAYNNMLEDVRPGYAPVDWVAHARSLGCLAEDGRRRSTSSRRRSCGREAAERTSVIVVRTAPHDWTPGGAFWEVGVPEVSPRAEVARGARPPRRGQARAAGRLVSASAPIRVGVLGVGRIGRMHAALLAREVPGLALAAVHDTDRGGGRGRRTGARRPGHAVELRS